MAWYDVILPFTYLILGILVFIIGFLLVYRSLEKVNIIEGEKFTFEDWRACIIFGLMFSLTTLFILNLTLEFLFPNTLPFIGDYLLIILLGILFGYPLWETVYLSRPTSDAVHDFHKFLEAHILDRFRGKLSILAAVLIFFILYPLPVIIISEILNMPIIDIAFIWFLIFPLFFLATYAALGQVGNIVMMGFSMNIPRNVTPDKGFVYIIKRIIGFVLIIIAWIPFFIAVYNIYNPVATYIQGGGIASKVGITAILSLFTTVVFGIQGFFKRFWNRKSKTRVIDFIFGGYIYIAIGVNMLINFLALNRTIVENVLNAEIFGVMPLINLKPLMENYAFLMPLIMIQSVVVVIYDIILLLRRRSEFYADMRLASVNKAFGLNINKLIKAKKAEQIKTKYRPNVLFKAILMPPSYSKNGVDINGILRKKAAQFLYLIAAENKDMAKTIVEILAENTIGVIRERLEESGKKIGRSRQILNKSLEFLRRMIFRGNIFISKEAVDLIGDIGKMYPDIALKPLLEGLKLPDIRIQRFILDALGDIGEVKSNIKNVVDALKPLLADNSYGLRTGAADAITEMVTEGPYTDPEFISIPLQTLYGLLEEHKDRPAVLETTLQCLLNLCEKIADKIEFDRIVSFIDYTPPTPAEDKSEEDTVEYIRQYAIGIIGTTVYYNVEKFPTDKIIEAASSSNPYIRRVAFDALGNYILKCSDEDVKDRIVGLLIKASLYDKDPDVVAMCIESIAEYLIVNRDYTIKINGEGTDNIENKTIVDFYLGALSSEDSYVVENASEALKHILPMYEKDYTEIISEKISTGRPEVARDLMHMLGDSGPKIIANIDPSIIYEKLEDENPATRAEAVYALGGMGKIRNDIDEKKVIKMMQDPDPQVRLEAIYALGKIGLNPTKRTEVIKALISYFYKLDKESSANISETELCAESLGIIGEVEPSNEIVIALQHGLMGSTNVMAKDVIANALWRIGNGMIKSGKAIRRIESEEFYNSISWFWESKKEYTIGNLVIIFIEAIQQKGIPESVMNIISDALQDLLPAFTFVKNERRPLLILSTIKYLLAQAYYSNYDQEILETIDRINSLMSFRAYFEKSDPILKRQSIFYAIRYTPDGKQFYDQGVTFMNMAEHEERYLDYAEKSFEIAIELAPHEYFTPDSLFQLGIIAEKRKDFKRAKEYFEAALEMYASFDEIGSMKKCDDKIREITAKIQTT